jgi:uncharacterized protein YcgI (DUF1989 family)
MGGGSGSASQDPPESASSDEAVFGEWHASFVESRQHFPTPLDREFYVNIARELPQRRFTGEVIVDNFEGSDLKLGAGDAMRLTLLDGPQVINLFAFNRHDPDERLWLQSIVREGLFLRPFSRVWGTMARHRPLMTMLEDSVVTRPSTVPFAQHHPIFGGAETRENWRAAGGPSEIKSTWDQLAGLMEARGLSANLLKEDICIFQKAALEPSSQRLMILPSDALAGDYVTFFAEIELVVLLALSPYRDFARPPSDTPPDPRRIEVGVLKHLADARPWPYDGLPVPDISRYVDREGRRLRELRGSG